MAANMLIKALPNLKAKHFATALGLCSLEGGILNVEN